jgi:hypothetical protein
MLFLAEFYLPAEGSAAVINRLSRMRADSSALASSTARFLQAVFVPQDECCYVLFQAPAAADVMAAGALAGLEFDMVSAAVAVGPRTAPAGPAGPE